ncbi:MAG: hypothetical protein ABR526_06745, partial [Chthoniobacterales bacterium]
QRGASGNNFHFSPHPAGDCDLFRQSRGSFPRLASFPLDADAGGSPPAVALFPKREEKRVAQRVILRQGIRRDADHDCVLRDVEPEGAMEFCPTR